MNSSLPAIESLDLPEIYKIPIRDAEYRIGKETAAALAFQTLGMLRVAHDGIRDNLELYLEKHPGKSVTDIIKLEEAQIADMVEKQIYMLMWQQGYCKPGKHWVRRINRFAFWLYVGYFVAFCLIVDACLSDRGSIPIMLAAFALSFAAIACDIFIRWRNRQMDKAEK